MAQAVQELCVPTENVPAKQFVPAVVVHDCPGGHAVQFDEPTVLL